MYTCMCVYTHTHMGRGERKIYYKELVHALMGSGKSQDLQGELTSWGYKKTALL